MKIREAKENDLEDIVKVLKASLGEAELSISSKIWRYKHINNPFGNSIVFVAEEDKKIVGVRALMKWQWCRKGRNYYALRAVDTATHPEYQGKGIFKKLTITAIEKAVDLNNDFIFNTPNDQSRPGYLKMGWESINKVHVGIKPVWNSFFNHKKTVKSGDIHFKGTDEQIQILCSKWNKAIGRKEGIFTPKSREYLSWRYEKCPLQKYHVAATSHFYLAAYIKKRKKLKELRISECIYDDWKKNSSDIYKFIEELSKRTGANVLTFSPSLFPTGKLSIKGNFGPILTIKKLNLSDKEFSDCLIIDNWINSLGDLELF